MSELQYKYYRFGSKNSLDVDMLIEHPDSTGIENDKVLIEQIKTNYSYTRDWNINIVKIKNGVIINSIPSKGSPDGVNNSLFETYHLHVQSHPFPLLKKLNRNISDAIEKCLTAIFTFYKKTNHDEFYKSIPKGIKNGKMDLKDRLSILENLNFNVLPYSDESKNRNAFKSITFHIGQTISLLNNVEIYTKEEFVYHYPDLTPIVKRTNINKRQSLNDLILSLSIEIRNFYQIG